MQRQGPASLQAEVHIQHVSVYAYLYYLSATLSFDYYNRVPWLAESLLDVFLQVTLYLDHS